MRADHDVESNCDEVQKTVMRLSNGKTPTLDGIPPEIFKCGGSRMVNQLTSLFTRFWQEGKILQEWKDAFIVQLYKRKGTA